MAQALSSGSSSPFSLGGAGTALGAAGAVGGLLYTLSQGPSPLPSQYNTVEGYSAPEFATGKSLVGTGESTLGAGTTALQSAAAGTLTPEQQAALQQTRTAETARAVQMYESMGRTPSKDTSFLSTGETIDANMLAAAQSFVQSNITLAGQLLTTGATEIGEGLSFMSAAAQNMIAAGQAQVQLDKDYSDSVSSAFGAIGKVFGSLIPGAASLSDARLKTVLRRIGRLANGIGVYSFRYLGGRTVYAGVVAQEVESRIPEAVLRNDNGIMFVDYSRLGDLTILPV